MLAKNGGTGAGRKKEDTFGMKDEDWDIYKAVSKVNRVHCKELFRCLTLRMTLRMAEDQTVKPSRKS